MVVWLLSCSTSRFDPRMESDLPFGRNWRFQHVLDGRENRLKPRVVTFLHALDLSAQFLMCSKQLPQTDEGAHDCDINLHDAAAAQDAREHGNTLLGENEWSIATAIASVIF